MDKSTPEHRYRFIELIAYWEGRINTSHLIQQFGLSRPHCSADISAYSQLAPGNLIYDKSLKVHLPSPHFNCRYISGDVVEYLNWLHNPAHLGLATPTANSLPNVALSLPPRHSLPHRQLRKDNPIKCGNILDSLPHRQLRKVINSSHYNSLDSLPHRQLRKVYVNSVCFFIYSLPHRQLRKVSATPAAISIDSLPHRQLRK